jgi:DmsE family decaheme c-type cytochrome
LDPGQPHGNNFFTQVSYTQVTGVVPTVAGAEYVHDDEICMTCHETYVKTFKNNVHRGGDSCEGCHGPASKHVEARGKEPGLIFSFKSGDPVVRAEACLKCHEQNACTEGSRWRTSKHAHCGVTCVDCHRAHYNVPIGTPATTAPNLTMNANGPQTVQLTSYNSAVPPPPQSAPAAAGAPPAAGSEMAPPAVSPEPVPSALTLYSNPTQRPVRQGSISFVNAPEGVGPAKLPSLAGTSSHLAAVAPNICYRCHCDMQDMSQIAGPHQICGPNGFNCTTCHDPHGKILESSRKDLCLQCHKGAPTMAWHSSIHNLNGVCCTDCHNPHPHACVPQLVNIDHSQIERPKRRPMCVDEPNACYKCHAKIYALNALPSHHPIKEGKMVCSDCHDPHGQETGNLKEATINLLCYKCHAEKQGPFAFEHPPVRENCAICHNPHGAVANNLLKQPATFLCLRCHAGHNTALAGDHPVVSLNVAVNTPTSLAQPLRAGFYTNCTQCHTQIHGTNNISERGGPLFTR